MATRSPAFAIWARVFDARTPPLIGPKQAGAGPSHALKKAAAIDPVVFVVVRNVIGHNIGFWFGLVC